MNEPAPREYCRTLVCIHENEVANCCGRSNVYGPSMLEVNKRAEADGWLLGENYSTYCPKCAKDPKVSTIMHKSELMEFKYLGGWAVWLKCKFDHPRNSVTKIWDKVLEDIDKEVKAAGWTFKGKLSICPECSKCQKPKKRERIN